jgi:periplasmic divalent cation tolerance protein
MAVTESDVVVALSTAPSLEKGADIARALVDEQLAACVNLVPGVRSIYRWQGEVCDEAEVLCVIKTRRARVEALRARLVTLHPYQVPELVVLDVRGGHLPYLSWVAESVP